MALQFGKDIFLPCRNEVDDGRKKREGASDL